MDKPPAALWVMVLSARLFGFSASSMLLPEARMGVGAMALVFTTVRRCNGATAGLIAGAVLALRGRAGPSDRRADRHFVRELWRGPEFLSSRTVLAAMSGTTGV